LRDYMFECKTKTAQRSMRSRDLSRNRCHTEFEKLMCYPKHKRKKSPSQNSKFVALELLSNFIMNRNLHEFYLEVQIGFRTVLWFRIDFPRIWSVRVCMLIVPRFESNVE
jgi:hypothetical protein